MKLICTKAEASLRGNSMFTWRLVSTVEQKINRMMKPALNLRIEIRDVFANIERKE